MSSEKNLESHLDGETTGRSMYMDLIDSLEMGDHEMRLLNSIVNPVEDNSLDEYETSVRGKDIREFVTRYSENRENLIQRINELIKNDTETSTHEEILDKTETRRYIIGAVRLDRVAATLMHPEGTSLDKVTTKIYVDDGLKFEGNQKIDIRDFSDELLEIRARSSSGENAAGMCLTAQDLAAKASERTGMHPAIITQLLMQQTGIKTSLSKGIVSADSNSVDFDDYRVEFGDGSGKILYFIDKKPFTIIKDEKGSNGKNWTISSELFESRRSMYLKNDSMGPLALVAAVDPTYNISPYQPKIGNDEAKELYHIISSFEQREGSEDEPKAGEESKKEIKKEEKPKEEHIGPDKTYGTLIPEKRSEEPVTEDDFGIETEADAKTHPPEQPTIPPPPSEVEDKESGEKIPILDEYHPEFDDEIEREIKAVLKNRLLSSDDTTQEPDDREISTILDSAKLTAMRKHESLVAGKDSIDSGIYNGEIIRALQEGIKGQIDELGFAPLIKDASALNTELLSLLGSYARISTSPELDKKRMDAIEESKEKTGMPEDEEMEDSLGWVLDELDRFAEEEHEKPGAIMLPEEETQEPTPYIDEDAAYNLVSLIQRSFRLSDGGGIDPDTAEELRAKIVGGDGIKSYLGLATGIEEITEPEKYRTRIASAFVETLEKEAESKGWRPADKINVVRGMMYDEIFKILGIRMPQEEKTEEPESIEDEEPKVDIESALRRYANTEYDDEKAVSLPTIDQIHNYMEEQGELADLMLSSVLEDTVNTLKEKAIDSMEGVEDGHPDFKDIMGRFLALTMEYDELHVDYGAREARDEIDTARNSRINTLLGEIDIHEKSLDDYLAMGKEFSEKTGWDKSDVYRRIRGLYESKRLGRRNSIIQEANLLLDRGKDPESAAKELESIGEDEAAVELRSSHLIKGAYSIGVEKAERSKSPLEEIASIKELAEKTEGIAADDMIEDIRDIIISQGKSKVTEGKFPKHELQILKEITELHLTELIGREHFDKLGGMYAEYARESGINKIRRGESARREIHSLYTIEKEYDVRSKDALRDVFSLEINQIKEKIEKKINDPHKPKMPLTEIVRIGSLSKYSLTENDEKSFAKLKHDAWSGYSARVSQYSAGLSRDHDLMKIIDIIGEVGEASRADISNEKIHALRKGIWKRDYNSRLEEYAQQLGTDYSYDELIEHTKSLDRANKFGIGAKDITNAKHKMIRSYIDGLKKGTLPEEFVDGMELLEEGLQKKIISPVYTEGLYELLEKKAKNGNYDPGLIRKLQEKRESAHAIAGRLEGCTPAILDNMGFEREEDEKDDYTNIDNIIGVIDSLKKTESAGIEPEDIRSISDRLTEEYASRLRQVTSRDEFIDNVRELENRIGRISSSTYLKELEGVFNEDNKYNHDLGIEIISRGIDPDIVAQKLSDVCGDRITSFGQNIHKEIDIKDIDEIYSLTEELKEIESLREEKDKKTGYDIRIEDLNTALEGLAHYLPEEAKLKHSEMYESSLKELEDYVIENGNLDDNHMRMLEHRIRTLYEISEQDSKKDEPDYSINTCVVDGITSNTYNVLKERSLEKEARRALQNRAMAIKNREVSNKKVSLSNKIYHREIIKIGYDEKGINDIGTDVDKDDHKYITNLLAIAANDGDNGPKYLSIAKKEHPEDEDASVMIRAINKSIRKLEEEDRSYIVNLKEIKKYNAF